MNNREWEMNGRERVAGCCDCEKQEKPKEEKGFVGKALDSAPGVRSFMRGPTLDTASQAALEKSIEAAATQRYWGERLGFIVALELLILANSGSINPPRRQPTSKIVTHRSVRSFYSGGNFRRYRGIAIHVRNHPRTRAAEAAVQGFSAVFR